MATLTVTAFDLLAGDQITAGLPSTTTITSLQHLVAGGAYVVRVVTTTLGTLDLPGGRTFTVQRTGTGPDEPGYDAALDAALAAILANTPTATGAALASSPALRAALGSADPVLSGFVYDGSGNLTQYVEDGITIILTYNSDGTVATSQRGPAAAKAYSYSGGNLVGVA